MIRQVTDSLSVEEVYCLWPCLRFARILHHGYHSQYTGTRWIEAHSHSTSPPAQNARPTPRPTMTLANSPWHHSCDDKSHGWSTRRTGLRTYLDLWSKEIEHRLIQCIELCWPVQNVCADGSIGFEEHGSLVRGINTGFVPGGGGRHEVAANCGCTLGC